MIVNVNRDALAGVALAVFGAAVAIDSYESYPIGSLGRMGPGMFPAMLGCALFAVAIAILVRSLVHPRTTIEINTRSGVFVLVSLALFAVMIQLFGVVPALLVLVMVSSAAARATFVGSTIVYSVLVTAGIVFIFRYLMNLNLDLSGGRFERFLRPIRAHRSRGSRSRSRRPTCCTACWACSSGSCSARCPASARWSRSRCCFPITYHLEPTAALIMLAGIYYGTAYGGSTASILLNLPGTPSNAVACLDGYPMAQQGRAAWRCRMTTVGSFVGGSIGIILMMMFAPVIADAALEFGPWEYVSR